MPQRRTQKTPRQKVGGMWSQIGRLQFDFLVSEGLQPHHYLLDVGCGCLRGGVHFIGYLDDGHYFGIDKSAELIRHGVHEELPKAGLETASVEFSVTDSFEVGHWDQTFDYALAQSVFTHLPAKKLAECFANLRPRVERFYATYWPASTGRRYSYDPDELGELARSNGWVFHVADHVGWDHPRGQKMAVFL